MLLRYSVGTGCVLAVLAAAGCKSVGEHNLPPAHRLMHPGPGVGGPGPAVLNMAPVVGPQVPVDFGTAQLLFVGPESMQVQWDVATEGQFDSIPLVTPGRQNFPQGGIYRLKLTNIPGRAGIELYPTVELAYTTPRSKAFLTHNAIPIQFTEEDLDQVMTNNYVTKVIYLPDPDYQDLAMAGVETLVSTRLDPGVDPIVEADRRGAIMAIVRIGNVDLEMPGAGEILGERVIQASHSETVERAGYGDMSFPPGHFPGHFPGHPLPFQPAPAAPGYVAGVTAPQYGMPNVGTPIGLPGPPHIPLGGPAGLQKHKMVNHTHRHLPDPSRKIKMDVKHVPGLSYPMPATNVKVKEHLIHPAPHLRQPLKDKFRRLRLGK